MRDEPEPEVSILVVSYNTRELTLAALDAVVRETRVPHEIIVVDNASTDGSADAIAAHPAAVRLIALTSNVGFGRANNIAAQHARGDYLLLLNPDTLVLCHAIDRLLGFAHQNPRAKIWGGRTIFPDGSLNPASCWGRITPWNQFCRLTGLTALRRNSEVFNGEALGGWKRDSVREVDIVSGCFLMIRRAFWQELRGFDPQFFMYGEEADLCLRARRRGARPLVTPDATIVHIGGASERTHAGKLAKLLAAKMLLIDRHVARGWRTPTRVMLGLWPLTRALAMTAAAGLTGSTTHAASANAWWRVWRQRSAWWHGYRAEAADGADHRLGTVPRGG